MASKKDYFYFIDTHSAGEKIAIVEKATSVVSKNGWTSDYKTVQTSGTNILKIRGAFIDDDLVAGTLTGEYTNIPSRFHDALVLNVISLGYLDPRNLELQKAELFGRAYDAEMKRAKKFARRNYVSTGRIVPQDF